MPESTLSLTTTDLQGAIGHYLGYGRGASFGEPTWTTAQTNNVTDVLKSALSQVYTPPSLGQGEPPHSWSFLRPFASLTLASGQSTVSLPDDFGGFEGPIYISDPAAARRRWELPLTNEGAVRQLHAAQPSTTGPPRMAAEQILKGTALARSTRSNLYVWPVADAAYTLWCEYKVLQDALTGALPYPPGGAEHAELFKASAIAAAELYLDDMPGPRWQYFMQRLAASVHADRKRKGHRLGYNGDRSDGRSWGADRRYFDNPAVTYMGDPL